jgi:hypothetical protein
LNNDINQSIRLEVQQIEKALKNEISERFNLINSSQIKLINDLDIKITSMIDSRVSNLKNLSFIAIAGIIITFILLLFSIVK